MKTIRYKKVTNIRVTRLSQTNRFVKMNLIKFLVLLQAAMVAAKALNGRRMNRKKARATIKQAAHQRLVMGLSYRYKARSRRHNKFVV